MKLFQLVLTLLMLQPFGLQAEDNETTKPVTKVMAWPDGTRYVGGVLNGERAGKGTIFWQDGTRFIGQFENDMRNGPGTMVLSDGTTYTAFFKNDKPVDIERTIAASAKVAAEPTDKGPTVAHQGTKLPAEADLLGHQLITTLSQPDENDLIQLVSGPEETMVGADASETNEKAVLAVKTAFDPTPEPEPILEQSPPKAEDIHSSDVTDITGAVIDRLIHTVDRWAAAWSDQDTVLYLANYSEDFAVPGRQSRQSWSALRKTRIMRPSEINLQITYQRFELVDTNVVDVFFQQAYRSNDYRDRVDKVLRLRKEDTGWKILIERSR